jgi:hypothetical protein
MPVVANLHVHYLAVIELPSVMLNCATLLLLQGSGNIHDVLLFVTGLGMMAFTSPTTMNKQVCLIWRVRVDEHCGKFGMLISHLLSSASWSCSAGFSDVRFCAFYECVHACVCEKRGPLYRVQLEAILSEAGSTERQKEEAMQLLAQQHEEIERYAKAAQEELDNKQQLEKKLKALEQRVVHGGENMIEKISELKQLAKATKAELEVQRYDLLQSVLNKNRREKVLLLRRNDPNSILAGTCCTNYHKWLQTLS